MQTVSGSHGLQSPLMVASFAQPEIPDAPCDEQGGGKRGLTQAMSGADALGLRQDSLPG